MVDGVQRAMTTTNAATALADDIKRYEQHTQETEGTDLDIVWELLERAEKVLRQTGDAAASLLGDIEEMREKDRPGPMFGGFSEWERDNVGTFQESVSVEWPNLAISAGRLAKALTPGAV